MGIRTIEKEDFEADDILATLATRGTADGYRVLLVSGDRDTIQLVNDDVTLLYPNTQGVSQLKRYDTDAVIERYGIRPEQYPDVAALVGETSDNLPGIAKVGEKTAVKWLGLYGDLDGILAHADEIKGVVGQNLRDGRENADPQPPAEPPGARRRARRRARRAHRQADRPRIGAADLRAPRVPHADRASDQARRGRGRRQRRRRPPRRSTAEPQRPRRRSARPSDVAHTRRRGARDLARRAVAAEPAGSGSASTWSTAASIGAGIADCRRVACGGLAGGPRRLRAVRGLARQRRAQDHDRRQGAAEGAGPVGLAFTGLVLDTARRRLAAAPVLQESRSPTSSPSTSARPCRRPIPNQLVPEEGTRRRARPSTPGTRCDSRPSCCGRCPRARVGCSPRSRCRSCRCSPRWSCRRHGRPRRARRALAELGDRAAALAQSRTPRSAAR